MPVKAVATEFQLDEGKREVTAYAAIFGNRDLVGDIVEPGAFKKTISERFPKLIKYARGHSVLIGKPLLVEEDSKGLLTVAKVSKTPAGEEAYELMRDGSLTHYSFRYWPMRAERSTDGVDANGYPIETRHLKELRLEEFGPVDQPCNEEAAILGVKSMPLELELPDALAEFARRKFLTTEEKQFARRLLEILPGLDSQLKALLAPEGATRQDAAPVPATPGEMPATKALLALLAAAEKRNLTFQSLRG